MNVVLDQSAPVVGDVEGNVRHLLGTFDAARQAGGEAPLVVSPELAVSGYPPRDLLLRPAFLARCRRAVDTLVAATRGLTAVFGGPWPGEGGLQNAAIVAAEGALVGVVAKRLLPSYDVFDEPRYFVPGTTRGSVDVGGRRLGVTVCEDLWGVAPFRPDPRYRVDPVAELGRIDLLVNLSASPFHAGKHSERRRLVAMQARRAGAPVVYVNQVGGNDHVLFDGRSIVVDAAGALQLEGPLFEAERLSWSAGVTAVPPVASWAEEVYAALVRGVRDYVRRSGFSSVVLGLSGGIDSALVATIAADALGPGHVLGVALPGPYSSPGSRRDAEALAANLGIRFATVDICDAWSSLREAVAPVVGATDGLVSENLQARARGVVLMAIANRDGRVLLTTGNKSELAVGYCTLYGDMNGGLGVIGDVYKTEVYELARWVNRASERIPQATIDKPPSAELAPGQLDQDTLPPYAVLDRLLRRHIEGADDEEAIAREEEPALVARVLGMVRRAEHKRWQAPPVLRVSPLAFGYGRRAPLVGRA